MSDYRKIDGTDNNPNNSQWGSTDEWFLRKSSPNYDDEISTPGGASRPSAREISNALMSQEGDIPNSVGASDFLWVWGQFIDHDIDLTMGGGDSFNISVPLYLYKGLAFTSFQYFGFTFIAIFGYLAWKKHLNKNL